MPKTAVRPAAMGAPRDPGSVYNRRMAGLSEEEKERQRAYDSGKMTSFVTKDQTAAEMRDFGAGHPTWYAEAPQCATAIPLMNL